MFDNPVTGILVPGVIGGLVMAVVIFRIQRRRDDGRVNPFERDARSTDVINAARIRVAGVGGLGLVATAVAVAFQLPRVGQALALGGVSASPWHSRLVVRRRKSGPMPSSGTHAGANTVLAIDALEIDAMNADSQPDDESVELGQPADVPA